ncbi:MAG: inositol phosphatase [Phycisphaerae bacterium]|nr:inositol phosphatase [Phycisphaerae bacterium]
MHTQPLGPYLDFALATARDAGALIMSHFRRCDADYKPDGSEVTVADREAELLIRAAITKHHPDHDILGEEFGREAAEAAPRSDGRPLWIIDPIDGTTSFTWGIHAFGTLIALVINDEPVVGVIHMPALDESVFAAKGDGCWFRAGRAEADRVRVAACDSLGAALVSASGVHATDIGPEIDSPRYGLSRVLRRARKLRFCGDCLQHALVCRGRIHAAIDTIMQPWDIAALVPCIEEAGGTATSLAGERKNIVYSGSLLTSANNTLHQELLEALAPDPASPE